VSSGGGSRRSSPSHTGQPLAKVASDLERDSYLSSEEALTYGVIDRVIAHR